MVWQQTISRYLQIPNVYRLSGNQERGVIVFLQTKHIFPSPPSIHDVRPGSGVFNTQRSTHGFN